MDAALEFCAAAAGQDCASSGWTELRCARRHKDVCRTRRLRDELTEGACGAFWGRNGITGRGVERRNEAATKILDFGEGVRLAAAVLQRQDSSLIERSSGWIEVPDANF